MSRSRCAPPHSTGVPAVPQAQRTAASADEWRRGGPRSAHPLGTDAANIDHHLGSRRGPSASAARAYCIGLIPQPTTHAAMGSHMHSLSKWGCGALSPLAGACAAGLHEIGSQPVGVWEARELVTVRQLCPHSTRDSGGRRKPGSSASACAALQPSKCALPLGASPRVAALGLGAFLLAQRGARLDDAPRRRTCRARARARARDTARS